MSNQRFQSVKNRTNGWFDNNQDDKTRHNPTSAHNQPSSPKYRICQPYVSPKSPPTLHIDLTGYSNSEDITTTNVQHSTKCSSSSSKKRKAEIENNTVGIYKKDKITKDNFVDLTLPVVFPALTQIKKENDLFFTYNPMGCDVPVNSDLTYCEHCRCPLVYCNNTVFGPMCYRDVERLVCKNGFEEFEGDREIKLFFRCTYTDLIKSKMLMNNVSLIHISEYRYMRLPKCVKRGSLRKLIDDIKLWKHEEDEVRIQDGLEPQTPDEDKIFLALETGEGLPEDLPPLDPPLSTSASGRVVNPYKNTGRTAVEQAADVGPMFKVMKKEVMKCRNE